MLPYSERRIHRVGIVGLVASFVLLILAFVFVLWGFSANQRASELVTHTYQIKDVISDASRDLERAEAARSGYLLDPSPYRLQVFEDTTAQLLPSIDRIDTLTVDNPAQQRAIKRLRPMVADQIRDMRQSIELARSGNAAEARLKFDLDGDRQVMASIRAATDQIEDREDALLTERLARDRRALDRVQWMLIGVGLALLIASLGTMWMLRRFARDLLTSRARLYRLNSDLEGVVDERTADLKRANEEIQRFAYIVSHDLRSPLVNVMGFTAELENADKVLKDFIAKTDGEHPGLVDETVRLAATEDLPEAINFIRSSTEKMDRLINAILALSRQGRRVLSPKKLDMNEVVGDIIGSLTTLADERDADIAIDGTLPTIRHDRLAIDQVFQNLIENATKYLRPGVPGVIRVRGRREGNRAIFEIEDNGRGIEPADHERIFDLFRRAGNQDQKGEGIGLAHVRALAYRLGGNVTVRSTPGEGSTFFVNLPISYDSEGDQG